MRHLTVLFALLAGLSLFTVPARADGKDEPRQIGQFQNWSAYRVLDHGNKVCYMAAQPKHSDAKPKADHRGDVYAMVTDRPADGAHNVFSFITGYTYKAHGEVSVTIDGAHFTLFTQDDTGWAQDGATDNKIAAAIKKGKAMSVSGVSARGTKTTDTFDLAGSKGAFQAIAKECGGK